MGGGRGDVDGEHWLELIRYFSGAQRFLVAGELANDIVRADGEARSFATCPAQSLCEGTWPLPVGRHCAQPLAWCHSSPAVGSA